ncbi:hypothetical protein ABZY36_28050 [Streptomyces sp. NPDC006627]|uniref:hypothetical protein n=1 Tax=Streptomyces sp. NPDC006627 TaxID=3154679 RepID=UPI0033B7AA9C
MLIIPLPDDEPSLSDDANREATDDTNDTGDTADTPNTADTDIPGRGRRRPAAPDTVLEAAQRLPDSGTYAHVTEVGAVVDGDHRRTK